MPQRENLRDPQSIFLLGKLDHVPTKENIDTKSKKEKIRGIFTLK